MSENASLNATASTADELRAVVDELARAAFDMSGLEFESKWNAGEYDGLDDPAVRRIAAVLPLS